MDILGLYGDNGKENGNYYTIIGAYMSHVEGRVALWVPFLQGTRWLEG